MPYKSQHQIRKVTLNLWQYHWDAIEDMSEQDGRTITWHIRKALDEYLVRYATTREKEEGK